MKTLFLSLSLLFSIFCFSQNVKQDSVQFSDAETQATNMEEIYISAPIDSVSIFTKNPMRAALYSAVLPGWGQMYNKRYWKAPIVWGLIGTGVGISLWYNDKYHEYRDAFVAEINGETHQYSGIYSAEVLATAQDSQRRNRDYAITFTVIAYIVNILDATVDAHLYEIRKDKQLKLNTTTIYDPSTGMHSPGLALKLNLK